MKKLNIALVAHDSRKPDLISWIDTNVDKLTNHKLFTTGTTGKMIISNHINLDVTPLMSGPLGGDQQLGAMIAEEKIDLLIFFWDPMTPQPHEPDVRALLRLSVLKNITIAENRNTADHIINSSIFADSEYTPIIKNYSKYIDRTM